MKLTKNELPVPSQILLGELRLKIATGGLIVVTLWLAFGPAQSASCRFCMLYTVVPEGGVTGRVKVVLGDVKLPTRVLPAKRLKLKLGCPSKLTTKLVISPKQTGTIGLKVADGAG